ncbi:glycine betaine ABC transporter substrate-binding protein [Halomonas caseinilytica]|uniref:glycine betaine ABC transporter substrate-binding protein n=1 Tax=Halomonas caseinilytica TaxID=438744 RepID=UPI0008494781|nr:glycine betaine ABC transporter substrate-binding protein [Halomonas caseinilytica]
MKRLMMTLSGLALAGAMTTAQAEEVNVGGKNYTEQLILANMTERYLDALGYDVTRRDGMGSAVLRQAQENGQIDLYWEYTGTSLIVYNNISESLSREATYEKVKELDAEKGLVWLEASEANNTYAMAMREDDAEEHGIETLDDLADAVNDDMDLTVGLDTEFYSRDDGWRPLQQTYGFKVGRSDIVRMDTGLMYSALRDGEVDVAVVFSTDGRVPAFDLRILEDNKGYFPAYALTPVVREETLEANPKLAEQMNALSALLDDQTMASLNARVDVERETIEDVAQSFLKEQGLL